MQNFKSKKLLIVDDDGMLVMMESALLSESGYEVLIALRGEDAVEIIKNDNDVELVIMDINLGKGINGYEAAKRILQIRDLPLIFLTSQAAYEIIEQISEIPCFGHVIKDSNMYYLFSSIKIALELYDYRKKAEIL